MWAHIEFLTFFRLLMRDVRQIGALARPQQSNPFVGHRRFCRSQLGTFCLDQLSTLFYHLRYMNVEKQFLWVYTSSLNGNVASLWRSVRCKSRSSWVDFYAYCGQDFVLLMANVFIYIPCHGASLPSEVLVSKQRRRRQVNHGLSKHEVFSLVVSGRGWLNGWSHWIPSGVSRAIFKQIAIFYCQWRLIQRLFNLWFPWATHKLWSGWDSCALCHGKTQRCRARQIQQITPCTLWKPRHYPGQINWHSKD